MTSPRAASSVLQSAPIAPASPLKRLLHEQAERVRLIGRKRLNLDKPRLAVKTDRLRLADAGFKPDGRKPLARRRAQ